MNAEPKGSILLIGFMGSGKSTMGMKLSYRPRRPFLDTDKWIEREQGMSVSEIFAGQGEEAFRMMETQTLRELKKKGIKQVISTGGGLPMREVNRPLLKELGTVVWLRIRPETVYGRLKGDTTRPLLRRPDPEAEIRRLILLRAPLYEDAADVIVDVDGKAFEEILEEIERKVEAYENSGD